MANTTGGLKDLDKKTPKQIHRLRREINAEQKVLPAAKNVARPKSRVVLRATSMYEREDERDQVFHDEWLNRVKWSQ